MPQPQRSALDVIIELLKWLFSLYQKSQAGQALPQAPTRPSPSPSSPSSPDPGLEGMVIEYSPKPDGHPDPGEVVWTWVPFEEDPTQGKDRPVVIIGRRGPRLVAVPLTSKQHDNEPQVQVGTGPWDRDGRVSYAKVRRLMDVEPSQVRREGATLQRAHFDDLVAGVRRHHR
jgi:hypothetical protein